MSDELRGRLRAFVVARFPRVKDQGLSDEDSLLESGAVDSLGVLDLARFIGDDLGIPLGDDDLTPENFDSISSLARFLARPKGAA